jgi:hypothetical protein
MEEWMAALRAAAAGDTPEIVTVSDFSYTIIILSRHKFTTSISIKHCDTNYIGIILSFVS